MSIKKIISSMLLTGLVAISAMESNNNNESYSKVHIVSKEDNRVFTGTRIIKDNVIKDSITLDVDAILVLEGKVFIDRVYCRKNAHVIAIGSGTDARFVYDFQNNKYANPISPENMSNLPRWNYLRVKDKNECIAIVNQLRSNKNQAEVQLSNVN